MALKSTTFTITPHTITGSIEVVADETQSDPNEIRITDSIVDATRLNRAAIGARRKDLPGSIQT